MAGDFDVFHIRGGISFGLLSVCSDLTSSNLSYPDILTSYKNLLPSFYDGSGKQKEE